jgi:ankyrin repeat protein
MDWPKALLARGASVYPTDKEGFTPLHWATMFSLSCLGLHGQDDLFMVEFLLKKGAEASAMSNNGCTL